MSDFATWLREWGEKEKWLYVCQDLANLCAQQHAALVKVNCERVAASNFRDAKCLFDGPGGLPRKGWCKPCIAEDAAQTRDALRDLLNLQTESGSNGDGPSSSDVLNSGCNGGRYLTPIQKRVYEYSDAGMRVPEIARELGVGKGEIRLILSLRRDRSR